MINNMLPLFASQYEIIWEEIMEVNQKPLEAFFFSGTFTLNSK